MDTHLPELGGIEATRHILQTDQRPGIVMLTMLEDDDVAIGRKPSCALEKPDWGDR